MRKTEKQNNIAKMLIDIFFSLQGCKTLIDYQSGIIDFIFTDRKFSVDINNRKNVQSTLAAWNNLYKPKNGAIE